MFVVLEGLDGCGKSTQARLLVAALERLGRDPIHLREPGGTWLGEQLRALLLRPDARIGPLAELALYTAARAELVEERIRPSRGARPVVLERYYYSTVAYQGHGLGLDGEWIAQLNRRMTGGLEPDRVLLLDLEPDEARRRIQRPSDRIEGRDVEFFARVREGYLAQARAQPRQWVVLEARGDAEAIHRRAWEAVRDLV
ncbi:MAG: dTMP kinase [Planctomycetota bacterium]